MSEENIYAPPTADIDEEESTKYLKHDGYSEDCMLLCNEHFISPKICIKTGEDLSKTQPAPEPVLLTVGRYIPSIRESFLVQGAWFIRITFLVIAVVFIYFTVEKIPDGVLIGPVLSFLIIFYLIHHFLNFCSATAIKIPLYLSPRFAMKRRRHFSCWNFILAISILILVIASLTGKVAPILILLSILVLCFSLTVIMSSIPLFKMKFRRGDYYYISNVHPYFLAALPLRN